MAIVVVIHLALVLVGSALLAQPGLLCRVLGVHRGVVDLLGHLDVLVPGDDDHELLPLPEAEPIGSSVAVCKYKIKLRMARGTRDRRTYP